jgi:pimeloyl-ACP methyl ester carboxylesterase
MGFVNDIDQTIEVETLRKITCPTLILHSKNDNSVPIDHARHAKSEITNSEIVLLDNLWGHMIWIGKDYESTQTEITSFIDRV